MKINSETHYLWRIINHEGEVLESYVMKRRDRKTGMKLLRKSKVHLPQPQVIVTDKLSSYGAASKVIGNSNRQEAGLWLSNGVENSHLLFRWRECLMLRLKLMRGL